jgi:hypothetical protein
MNSPDQTPEKKRRKRPSPKKGGPLFKTGLDTPGFEPDLVMAKDALAIATELESLKSPGISQKQRQDALFRLARRARSSAQTCRIRIAGAPKPSYPA